MEEEREVDEGLDVGTDSLLSSLRRTSGVVVGGEWGRGSLGGKEVPSS